MKSKSKSIDYTLVEEYLDSLLEDDPVLLMKGITPLYKQVAKHFRPVGCRRSPYSWASVSQAVRDYYDSKNVDPKILLRMTARELHRKGMTCSASACEAPLLRNLNDRRRCYI